MRSNFHQDNPSDLPLRNMRKSEMLAEFDSTNMSLRLHGVKENDGRKNAKDELVNYVSIGIKNKQSPDENKDSKVKEQLSRVSQQNKANRVSRSKERNTSIINRSSYNSHMHADNEQEANLNQSKLNGYSHHYNNNFSNGQQSAELQRLRELVAGYEEGHERLVRESDENVSKFKSYIHEMDRKVEAMQRKLEAQESKIKELHKALQSKENACKEHLKKIDDNDRLKQQIKAVQGKLTAKSEEIAQLRNNTNQDDLKILDSLKKAQVEANGYKEQLAAKNAEYADLALKCRQAQECLQKELWVNGGLESQSKQGEKDLQEKNASLLRAVRQSEELQRKVEELARRFEQQVRRNQELATSNEELFNRLAERKDPVKTTVNTSVNIQQAVHRLEGQRDALRVERDALRGDRQKAKIERESQASSWRASQGQFEKEITFLKERILFFESNHSEITNHLIQNHRQKEQEVRLVQQQAEQAGRTAIDPLEEKIQFHLKQKDARINALEKQRLVLMRQNAELNALCNSYQHEFETDLRSVRSSLSTDKSHQYYEGYNSKRGPRKYGANHLERYNRTITEEQDSEQREKQSWAGYEGNRRRLKTQAVNSHESMDRETNSKEFEVRLKEIYSNCEQMAKYVETITHQEQQQQHSPRMTVQPKYNSSKHQPNFYSKEQFSPRQNNSQTVGDDYKLHGFYSSRDDNRLDRMFKQTLQKQEETLKRMERVRTAQEEDSNVYNHGSVPYDMAEERAGYHRVFKEDEEQKSTHDSNLHDLRGRRQWDGLDANRLSEEAYAMQRRERGQIKSGEREPERSSIGLREGREGRDVQEIRTRVRMAEQTRQTRNVEVPPLEFKKRDTKRNYRDNDY